MAPGRKTRQQRKARGDQGVANSSRVLRSGNRPVVGDVPEDDDIRAVVGRAPVVTRRRHSVTGRVDRRTINAAEQSSELPFLPRRSFPFLRRIHIRSPSPPSHRDSRSSRRGVLQVETRFPQRSNRAAVLDRINVSVNGTRPRRVSNARTIGMLEAPITTPTPIGGAVIPARPYPHPATLPYPPTMNEVSAEPPVGRLTSPSNSDMASPLPTSLDRPVIIATTTTRRDLGDRADQIHTFHGGFMFEIPDFSNNELTQEEFFDMLTRAARAHQGGRLVVPPNQIFNSNADPFDMPEPLAKRLGNSGEACTICHEDDVADVKSLISLLITGCLGCLIGWVQANSVDVESGVRYVPNRDHLTCPLCRHPWETARPEVFRYTETSKEQVTGSSQRKPT
uniref:RING-type domain-containing protein n=1 Tax=Rhabditophanes sp. KR3021 TaxID=114890 RepID=A0AC35TWP7_9BILA